MPFATALLLGAAGLGTIPCARAVAASHSDDSPTPGAASTPVPSAAAPAGVEQLAVRLAACRESGVAARWRGDLQGVAAAMDEELALGDAVVAALARETLPPPGDPGRPPHRMLLATARRHRWSGAWIDSLSSRVMRLPADDPDLTELELIAGLALSDTDRDPGALPHLERAAASTEDPLAPEASRRALALAQRLLGTMQAGADRTALRRAALALADRHAEQPGATHLAAEIARFGVEIACAEPEEGGDAGACLERGEAWLAAHPGATGHAVILLLVAEARERDGDLAGAEQALVELLARYPAAPETRPAWSRYLGVRRARGAEPEARVRHLIAVSLARQGERPEALRELELLLDAPDVSPELAVQSRLLAGMTLRRSGQPEAAIIALDAIDRSVATVRQRRQADLWRARALWSAERIDSASAAYEALAADPTSGRTGVIASWEQARMFEDEERLEAARAAYRTLARRHPSASEGIDAVWRAGLCAYRLGDLEGAASELAAALAGETPEQTQRRLYWLGRVENERGRNAEARTALEAAARSWPRDYYGWRAVQRLAALDEAAKPPARLPETLVEGFRRLAAVGPGATADSAAAWPAPADAALISGLSRDGRGALARGLRCLDLGLVDAARRDLRAVEREVEHDPDAMLRLAGAYMARGVYDRAVSCGWDARQRWLGTPHEALALRALYPIAFAERVLVEAAERDVDPLLVMALMRRESRFDPAARSHANAHGLMQLMPYTAKDVARRLGTRRPSRADLFRPEVNLKLGIWYLASVLRETGNRADHALAAYNAGPRRVARWRALSGGSDPDLFIELIGFRETRNYVRKVLNDFFYYQAIDADPAWPPEETTTDTAGDHER